MSYKIVIDSCGELLDEWKKDPRFESVALTLSVGGENIIDDENFDQASFLKKVADKEQKLPEVGMSVTGTLYEGV